MRKLFSNTIYIKLQPDNLTALHVESGKIISEVPVLAYRTINGKRTPLSVGAEAIAASAQSDVTLVNGFKHPRTLLADFAVGEVTLKLFLKKMTANSFFRRAPIIILHPLCMLEGGLTQIEIRGFAELARSAGAQKVFIWSGAELPEDSLNKLIFTNANGALLYP